MPDSELDAILNAVSTEIQDVLDQDVDLAAGHAQVVQEAGDGPQSHLAARLTEALRHWPESPSTCKEFTMSPSDAISVPHLGWRDLARAGRADQSQAKQRVCEVLSRLEGVRHTVLRWDALGDCAHRQQAVAWNSARVIMILEQVQCGLVYRSLPRQDALSLIDQLDHEIRPLVFVFWQSTITRSCPSWSSDEWTEVDQGVGREPRDQYPSLPTVPETPDSVADPYTVITELDQLRQDIDQLFDDNDHLVTC
jgi:hypothetical protein